MKAFFKNILIFLGAFMFFVFIWLKFIRERLPKDLPFNLSWLGFFCLLYICMIYLYLIYKLIIPAQSSNKFIESLVKIIYEPLKRLDQLIKNVPFFNEYYLKFFSFLISKLSFVIIKTNILYISLRIIPRFILVSVLFSDVFIFHKLLYIYKVILVGILIILFRYLKYSLKYYFETNLQLYQDILSPNMAYEYAIQIVEDTPPEDPEEEDFIPPTMGIPLDIFIEFQTQLYFEGKEFFPYDVYSKNSFFTYYRKKNNISEDQELISENYKKANLWRNNIVTELLNLKIILVSLDNASENKQIKNVTLLMYINYLICWIYILIISFYTLKDINLIAIIKIIEKYSILIEPFSQIPLFNHENLF